jgi:hypothetical protein
MVLPSRPDRPIVAFNRVPSTDSPNPEPGEPENFYVRRSGTGAVLSKQAFAAPEGVEMAARYVLRGTIIAAGDRISEHIVTDGTSGTRMARSRPCSSGDTLDQTGGRHGN